MEHKDPVKNEFAWVGVAALGWQGARGEHTGSIRPTRNAAKRDASAAECRRSYEMASTLEVV